MHYTASLGHTVRGGDLTESLDLLPGVVGGLSRLTRGLLEGAEEVTDPLLAGELCDLVSLAVNNVSDEASNMDVQSLVFLNSSCPLHEGE